MTEKQAKLLDEAFAAFRDEVGPLVRPEGPGAVQRTVRRRRHTVATTCAAVVLFVAAGPVVVHRALTGAPAPPSSPTAPASAPATWTTRSTDPTPTPSADPTVTPSATADPTPTADPDATEDPPPVVPDRTTGPPASTPGATAKLLIEAPPELLFAPVDTDGLRRGTLTVTVVNDGDTTVDRPAVVVPSSSSPNGLTPEHTAWSCPEVSGRGGRVFCLLDPLAPGERRQVAVPMLGSAAGGPSPDGTVYVRADYDDFSSPGAAATYTVAYAD